MSRERKTKQNKITEQKGMMRVTWWVMAGEKEEHRCPGAGRGATGSASSTRSARVRVLYIPQTDSSTALRNKAITAAKEKKFLLQKHPPFQDISIPTMATGPRHRGRELRRLLERTRALPCPPAFPYLTRVWAIKNYNQSKGDTRST